MDDYEQGYEDDCFESVVSQNFHCPICLNVFKDPVMCQRNQHCFCRPCITRHLKNSQTCPTCKEELTLDTITQAPRILLGCLSELKIRCDHFSRGCREFVQLGDLEAHVKDCGFTAVQCSNEGCLVEFNKQDRTHHETEVCEFRKVKCHDCVEIKKEIEELKADLTAVKDRLDDMKDLKKSLTAVERQLGEVTETQSLQTDQLTTLRCDMQRMQEVIINEIRATGNKAKNEKGCILVAGGRTFNYNEMCSVEMYDSAKRTWSQMESMKVCRVGASSFIHKDTIHVTGGNTNHGATNSIIAMGINPTMDSARWYDIPLKLPSMSYGHGCVVTDERLVIVGGYARHLDECSGNIFELLLYPPYSSRCLSAALPRCFHGIELFNHLICIAGGIQSIAIKESVDSVVLYDINRNVFKQMAPLPFAMSEMATVPWGNNAILIGGADKDDKALNTVVMYNVQTGESHMLPEMKCKRRGCVAVVSQNTIVVMGGRDGRTVLNSVEIFNFESYTWEELPPMNEARERATAVAW